MTLCEIQNINNKNIPDGPTTCMVIDEQIHAIFPHINSKCTVVYI